jgi:hypothetical protein
LTTPDSD